MSHMVQLDIQFADIAALSKACDRIGLEVRDKRRFAWFGKFHGDSIGLQAQQVPEAEYDHCAYAIGRKGFVPGNTVNPDGSHIERADGSYGEYEIGVIRKADGTYTLRFDYWGPGQLLSQACGGDGLKKLEDEYGYAVAEAQAYEDGYEVERIVEADGTVIMQAVSY